MPVTTFTYPDLEWLQRIKIKATTLNLNMSSLITIAVEHYKPNITMPQGLQNWAVWKKTPPVNSLEINEWVEFMDCIENINKVDKLITQLSKKADYQRRRLESEKRKR